MLHPVCAGKDEISAERARVQALFVCVLRPVVEKHGGKISVDPMTQQPLISIPPSSKTACFEELGELLAPGTPLNDLLPFFS
jgi:hypothetical protein